MVLRMYAYPTFAHGNYSVHSTSLVIIGIVFIIGRYFRHRFVTSVSFLSVYREGGLVGRPTTIVGMSGLGSTKY
jgi:hypothetical protein